MKTNELKNVVVRELGLKSSQIAVRTLPSVDLDKWVEVRVRPQPLTYTAADLVYQSSFTDLHRRIALAIVYGPEFARKQSTGGNIGLHSISLFASQWVRFCETLAAVRQCCSPTTVNTFEVALSYLNTRVALA